MDGPDIGNPHKETEAADLLAASLQRRHVRFPRLSRGGRPGQAGYDTGLSFHDWSAGYEVLSGPSTGIECTEIGYISAREGEEVSFPASRDCLLFAIDGAGTFTSNGEPLPCTITALRAPCALFIPAGTGGALQVASPNARLLAVSDLTPDLTRAGDPARAHPSMPLTAIAVSPAFPASYRGTTGVGSDFAVQPLVSRSSGSSRLKAFAATMKPGSGMDFHFHRFDQFYFVLTGEMEVGMGNELFTAAAGSLVVIPAGVVHRNRNARSDDLMQLTIVSHEPPQGHKPSTAVRIDQI